MILSSWTAPLSSSPLPKNSENHVLPKRTDLIRILGERVRVRGNPFHDVAPPLIPLPQIIRGIDCYQSKLSFANVLGEGEPRVARSN